MKSLVLLSGGIDSAVLLAEAIQYSKEVICLHYNYSQPTEEQELENAKRLSKHYDVNLFTKDIHNIIGIGGLTSKNKDYDILLNDFGISSGYVPYRNLLFLTIAAGVAREKNCRFIWIGAQAIDKDAYPDCRRTFMNKSQECLQLSFPDDEVKMTIMSPFLDIPKFELIKKGQRIGVPFEKTISCYKLINGSPCGKCGACEERIDAFKKAGVKAPLNEVNEYGK